MTTPQYPKINQFAPRDNQPWTLEEQERVIARAIPDTQLCVELGRSGQAVQTKRCHIMRDGYTYPGEWSGRTSSPSPSTRPAQACCPSCYLELPATGECDDCS